HLAMSGFIAFIIWGCTYGLLPRLTGAEPDTVVVGIHFWLALVGYGIYIVAISVAGILQGFAWVGGKPFLDSVVAAEPFWLWRTVGGLLMVASHLCFAWNVWRMRAGRAQVGVLAQSSEAAPCRRTRACPRRSSSPAGSSSHPPSR